MLQITDKQTTPQTRGLKIFWEDANGVKYKKQGIIYELENGNFVIADHAGWLPGAFDSRESAEKGLRMRYGKLQALWNFILSQGKQILTMQDM